MVSRCSLYKDSEEITNHILIHCDRKKKIVESYFSDFLVEVGVSRLSEKPSPMMEKRRIGTWFPYFVLVYMESVIERSSVRKSY